MMATIAPRGRALAGVLDRIEPPAWALAVQYHCQASLAIKAPGTTLYIDPWYSDHLDRVSAGQPFASHRLHPSPLAPADVTNADYVLITHDHLDHLDPGTIPDLLAASPRARIIAPQAACAHLRVLGVALDRLTTIRIPTGDTLSQEYLFDGVALTAIKGTHDGFDDDPEHGYPWLGYIVRANGVTVFHSGDTQAYDGQVAALAPFGVDVACLPINGGTYRTRGKGFKGNLDYQEAADLGVAIGADWIIPIHYGALSENDEKGSRFVDYIEERYPAQRFHLLRQGETIMYHKWMIGEGQRS